MDLLPGLNDPQKFEKNYAKFLCDIEKLDFWIYQQSVCECRGALREVLSDVVSMLECMPAAKSLSSGKGMEKDHEG